MLAIFVGYYVVWSVTPALHTPLMSVTNAISSVIVVGALLAVGVDLMGEGTVLARFFGFFALMLASVNIFGGFLVTQRMLACTSGRSGMTIGTCARKLRDSASIERDGCDDRLVARRAGMRRSASMVGSRSTCPFACDDCRCGVGCR